MRQQQPVPWGLVILLVGVTCLGWGCNVLKLTPTSQVIRPRVAGIQAEPAEISLGESTELRALFVHPPGEEDAFGAIWFSCVQAGSATGCLGLDTGAFLSAGGVEPEGDSESPMDDELMTDPRNNQFGVGDAFSYTAHGSVIEDAWDALGEADRVEGLVVMVSVTYVRRSNEELEAMLLDLNLATSGGDSEAIEAFADDFLELLDDGVSAARRIVVSDKTDAQPDPIDCPTTALTPNNNPYLDGVLLHEAEDGWDQGHLVGTVTFVEPEETLVLRPILRHGGIEDYLYITTDGETECRRETPWFAWLTNAGAMEADYSFVADEGDYEEVEGRLKVNQLHLPPAEEMPDRSDLWIVARDRRGGLDWTRVQLARTVH